MIFRATSRAPRAVAVAVCAAAAVLAAAAPGAAQERPRVRVGAGIGMSLLVGEEGSDFLDSGLGAWLGATVRLDARDRLHLHAEAEWTPLEPHEDEPSGGRADNDLFTLAAGPQVSATLGPVRPYLGALAGATVGRWSLDAAAAGDGARSGAETAFGWGARAGVALDVERGARPVAVVAEARIFDPGALLFARARGTNQLGHTTRADVAVLSLRLGATLGF